MARRARTELAGGIHHVIGKTPSGRLLFIDDVDRQRYLQLLAREIREREWRLFTYSQLTNHLHLLVQTPQPDLGAGFKRLHEDYARHVNRRHALGGHVFGGRFYSGIVMTDRHMVGCFRYIARNPIEARICQHPREWPWSAHRALAGLDDPPAFLDVRGAYSHLGANESEARMNYLRLVARSDGALLADIARAESDAWLVSAVDDFRIPIETLGGFLRLGRTRTYERLAEARRTAGSVPPVRFRTLGTVP
jgi:REP element-mobilizing transposase RayT